MKINRHIFHLPPFISTPWSNITSLHLEQETLLIVCLKNGSRVRLPTLDPNLVQAIFAIHAQILEQEYASSTSQPQAPQQEGPIAVAPPSTGINPLLSINVGAPTPENLGAFMQHNPENAHAPDLPHELLEKVSALSKTIGLHDTGGALPKPEPHCNCHFCQIAKAMNVGSGEEEQEENSVENEEEVSDEDLKFRNWDIQQTADNLFIVSNPVDVQEHYSVFLGDPIGCTCGAKNCEHIRAVLQS